MTAFALVGGLFCHERRLCLNGALYAYGYYGTLSRNPTLGS